MKLEQKLKPSHLLLIDSGTIEAKIVRYLFYESVNDDKVVSPIKPFPSPDKREKIVKMIEISDERLENSFGFDKEEDREVT